ASAEARGAHSGPLNVVPGLADAIRQRANGHADIGGDNFSGSLQSSRGPIGIMARLPKPASIFWLSSPFKIPAAVVAGNLGEGRDLLGRRSLGAVKLQEER